MPRRSPRGVAPSAARGVGRNAALLPRPFRATCAGTTTTQPCRPHHCRTHSPLPCRKPDCSPPPGLLRSPRHSKGVGFATDCLQFSPAHRFLQPPFASPVATKPKAFWPMEAPRGFALAFLRVDQAIAPNGGRCRALKPRLGSHPALKSPGLALTTAAQAPPRPHRSSADKSHLGQLTSPSFQGTSWFNPLAAQPALPRPAKPFWLRSPLTACSLSPEACGFTAGLSASPPSRPTAASAAGRAVHHHRRRGFFRIFAAPVAPGRSPVR